MDLPERLLREQQAIAVGGGSRDPGKAAHSHVAEVSADAFDDAFRIHHPNGAPQPGGMERDVDDHIERAERAIRWPERARAEPLA